MTNGMFNENWCRDQENKYINQTAENYPDSLHGGSKGHGVYVTTKDRPMKPLVKVDGILKVLEEDK